ncbi:MAG: HAD family hydrolase [Clostridia bacterium]|nr:HAD family hydrolase [Clostridia bacterium]
MRYEYLLFDLDGTLTDPGEGITNSVMNALAKRGIAVSDRSELYCFIGPPLSESFSKYFGFDFEESLRCVEDYREYFGVRGLFENEVYSGIYELLSELRLRGHKIVLATSKPEKYAKQILDHFNLTQYFAFVAGATMDESRNKKADVIRYALDSFGIKDLKNAIMIGDREQDVLGAHKCGLDSIGVLYGYGSREEHESAGATYIAETVNDILNLV